MFVLRPKGQAGVSEVRGQEEVVQVWALWSERTWTMGLAHTGLKDLTRPGRLLFFFLNLYKP